ncbi:MAG: polymerase, partial [Cytophagales bacterium]|nr:polymerase [Rhizobacter sp.]
SMALILGGTLALYDYMRVVVIFAPPANAAPLEQRIAEGRRSVLFAHHADYAAATTETPPGHALKPFERATHYLLDTRLMVAWAKALARQGELDNARFIAARLREFRNPAADDFFAACKAAAASAPFQCEAPGRQPDWREFVRP